MSEIPETGYAAWGESFVDQAKGLKLFFSLQLSEEQRVILGELNKKQIIFEAETLCALLAHALWVDAITHRMCFLYVDNEGTKFCLMKGSSENPTVDAMTQVFVESETHVRTLCWLARVSSFSNLADEPSRGDTQRLNDLSFVDVSKDAATCLKLLCMSITEKMVRMAGHAQPK